jgi:hypothetical protein
VGRTNETLEIEAGNHTVTLNPPRDFDPLVQEILLQNTTVISPATVVFEQIVLERISPVEYLLVSFTEDRDVLLDDRLIGRTNETLEVEAGFHTVALTPPEDYLPASQDVAVRDTSAMTPARVVFVPIHALRPGS